MGGLIKEAKGGVDLDNAELTVHLEVMPDHAFYFWKSLAPAGTDRDRRSRGVSAQAASTRLLRPTG